MMKVPVLEELQDVILTSESEDEEFTVEEVLGKRLIRGKTQYFIKWNGLSALDNTWEPEEHIDRKELIKKFEDKSKEAQKTKEKTRDLPKRSGKRTMSNSTIAGNSSDAGPSKERKYEATPHTKELAEKKEEFEEEEEEDDNDEEDINSVVNIPVTPYVPEKILGSTDEGGELMYLLKYKDTDEADLIPAKELNLSCPQIVISFFEERIIWEDPEHRISN